MKTKRIKYNSVVMIQVGLSFLATLCTYYLHRKLFLFNSELYSIDRFNFFHYAFPPIIIVIICGIAGLPIRLNNRLNNWWRKHYYISIMIAIIGILISLLSYLPELQRLVPINFEETHFETRPNEFLSTAGYFFISSGILHTYPPNR